MEGKKDLSRGTSRRQRYRGGNMFSDFKNSKEISVAEQNEYRESRK